MLAQFSIWPLDTAHMSEDVARVTKILDQRNVCYELGPMGTTLEGEWDEVMSAIKACQEDLRQKHQRVLTSITLDDDPHREQTIGEAKAKVLADR